MLHIAPGVVSKQYRECTQEELKAAYIELFGIAPCAKCNGIDWTGIHQSIIKQYNKLLNNTKMQSGKYIWNPIHGKIRTYINGRPVDSTSTDQTILEKIFNDPKRAGLVIINPDYKEDKEPMAKKVDEPIDNTTEKELVQKLATEGKTKQEIKAETGISANKIKKYLQ